MSRGVREKREEVGQGGEKGKMGEEREGEG